MRKDLIKALSSITQLGINVVVSFILWILIAAWVKKTFNSGNYVMVIGVILGAGSAFLSFFKYLKEIEKASSSKEDD